MRDPKWLLKCANIQFNKVTKPAVPVWLFTMKNESCSEIQKTLSFPTGKTQFDCSAGGWNSLEFCATSGHTPCLDVGELLDVLLLERIISGRWCYKNRLNEDAVLGVRTITAHPKLFIVVLYTWPICEWFEFFHILKNETLSFWLVYSYAYCCGTSMKVQPMIITERNTACHVNAETTTCKPLCCEAFPVLENLTVQYDLWLLDC